MRLLICKTANLSNIYLPNRYKTHPTMPVLRLTLRQLQIFAAVAGCGSTTAASSQLALSQSATSSAINELERLLSLSLFDRVGKGKIRRLEFEILQKCLRTAPALASQLSLAGDVG